ncbi:rhodanese-like domain-containing protein [Erythrobacter neustonensis]|uniref:Rhodanese n=1 Tax=Erythrobacter neustonensis TaxID=1112 RepID=A0A192D3M2_9SPHN|nr:rhodanese-like domain-containing protein [Erythrobacter neustonensis]ANK12705.1 rhodanese [Erythrobacter neustonensis]
MIRARLVLPLWSAALLALAACGGEADGEQPKRDAPSPPFGLELAFASFADEGGAANPAPSPLSALTPAELAARIAAGNVRLIDVSTDAEVAEARIAGAEHIALDRFEPETLDLSDGREVVLYCRSGRLSAIAGERLAAVTGAPVVHLDGGLIAWEAAGLPVETAAPLPR